MSEQAVAPQPPQAPPEPSFEQAVAGVHKFYKRFRAVDLAYRQINDTLNDRRDSPIFEMPTGHFDEDEKPITVPMDVERLLRGLDGQQRKDQLLALLGPWNNYFAGEYSDALEQLKRFVDLTYKYNAQAQRQSG